MNNIEATIKTATLNGELQEIFQSLIQIQSALIKTFGQDEASSLINSALKQAIELQ